MQGVGQMKRQFVLWLTIVVLIALGWYGVARLFTQQSGVRRAAFSLSPGALGMISSGYYYADLYTADALTTPEPVSDAQRYLDRIGDPELALKRIREFTWAYQVDVIERSSGRHAFGLMLGKARAQISPKAGPNLFWNTKYGPMIAEVGGGYGMLGRLLAHEAVPKIIISESEARGIADKAAAGLGRGFGLDEDSAVFYGFYEFYASQNGQLVGEIDVNAYNGQVWYKEWGEPPLQSEDLIPH